MCKSDIDLVLDVHPVERPARAYRNTSRAPRGRCLDPHVQVFLLDEHLGQGRYPIRITEENGRLFCCIATYFRECNGIGDLLTRQATVYVKIILDFCQSKMLQIHIKFHLPL